MTLPLTLSGSIVRLALCESNKMLWSLRGYLNTVSWIPDINTGGVDDNCFYELKRNQAFDERG